MRLLLMRHLKTRYNGANCFCGAIDCEILPDEKIKLNDEAKALLVENEVAVFVSPMLRCVQTLQKVREEVNLQHVIFENAIVERNYGKYNGVSKSVVEREFKDRTMRPPGGESALDVRVRVHNWLNSIHEKHENIFVVTHQGVLREIYSWMGKKLYDKFNPGEIRMEEV